MTTEHSLQDKLDRHLSYLSQDEHNTNLLLEVVNLYLEQNELDQPIKLLNQYLKHHPKDAEILGFLSLLYFDNNNDSLAHKFSQKALKINPNIYDAQVVDIMLRLITRDTTVEEINQLIKVNPQESRLWFALGSTYMAQGDFPSAIEQYQKTLAIHPEFYDCYIALAWSQLLINDIPVAHETYQNAISLADYLSEGWAGLAIIYGLKGDFEQAQQLIVKAESMSPECFLTQIAQVIYLNHHAPKQAQKKLYKALTNQQIPVSEKLALIIEEMM